MIFRRFSNSQKNAKRAPPRTRSQELLDTLGVGEHGDKLQAEKLVNAAWNAIESTALNIARTEGFEFEERGRHWAVEVNWYGERDGDGEQRFWERISKSVDLDNYGKPLRVTVGHRLKFKPMNGRLRTILLTVSQDGRAELHGLLSGKLLREEATPQGFERLLRAL